MTAGMNPDIVTIDDVRGAGYCASGTRRWAERQGIDFRAFLRDGLDAQILLATGDGRALRVVARARCRRAARAGAAAPATVNSRG